MDSIVLLLLLAGFAVLAFTAWRARAAANPNSSVEGFAKVLAAIDPSAHERVETDEPAEIEADAQIPDFRPSAR